MKKANRTQRLLKVMHILAWIAFIGFSIEAGTIIFSYVLNFNNPAPWLKTYKDFNTIALRDYSFVHYTVSIAALALITCLKATVAWLAIKALGTMNMRNPFTKEVSQLLESISYLMLAIAITGLFINAYAKELRTYTIHVPPGQPVEELLFITGIVFIISGLFKRGVELQSEQDLTV